MKTTLNANSFAAQAEPVAWIDIEADGTRHGLREWSDGTSREVPLYLHPPAVQIIAWINEDTLPADYPYDAMHPHSRVDGVRMFPVFAPLQSGPLPSASHSRDLPVTSAQADHGHLAGDKPASIAAMRQALDWLTDEQNEADEDCGDPACDECEGLTRPRQKIIDALKRALGGREMSDLTEFFLYCDDDFVASVTGPRHAAVREILRYAAQYTQDGEIRVDEITHTTISIDALRAALGDEK